MEGREKCITTLRSCSWPLHTYRMQTTNWLSPHHGTCSSLRHPLCSPRMCAVCLSLSFCVCVCALLRLKTFSILLLLWKKYILQPFQMVARQERRWVNRSKCPRESASLKSNRRDQRVNYLLESCKSFKREEHVHWWHTNTHLHIQPRYGFWSWCSKVVILR